MTHARRAGLALARLAEHDPALGALSLWCGHRDDPGQTRTEGDVIFYGPGFDHLPAQEQMGLAAHHILHVALRHSARAGHFADRMGQGSAAAVFGLSADAIVNETLLLAGQALPRPLVRLTELLRAVGHPAQDASAALADWDVERLAMLLLAYPEKGSAARAYGKSKSFQADISDSPQDGQEHTAEWRGHVQRALEAGRNAGQGLGLFGNLLADVAPPELPWEVLLRGALARALADRPQPSWRRPTGRWVAAEAQALAQGGQVPGFEPGRARQSACARVVVALDTSGSVDAVTRRMFATETTGIARRSGAELWLLGFNDAVHTEVRLDPRPDALAEGLEMHLGGGTDFGPPVARAAELAPSVLVLLTDCDGPFGPPPRFPVLWATPNRTAEVPFGQILQIGR